MTSQAVVTASRDRGNAWIEVWVDPTTRLTCTAECLSRGVAKLVLVAIWDANVSTEFPREQFWVDDPDQWGEIGTRRDFHTWACRLANYVPSADDFRSR